MTNLIFTFFYVFFLPITGNTPMEWNGQKESSRGKKENMSQRLWISHKLDTKPPNNIFFLKLVNYLDTILHVSVFPFPNMYICTRLSRINHISFSTSDIKVGVEIWWMFTIFAYICNGTGQSQPMIKVQSDTHVLYSAIRGKNLGNTLNIWPF